MGYSNIWTAATGFLQRLFFVFVFSSWKCDMRAPTCKLFIVMYLPTIFAGASGIHLTNIIIIPVMYDGVHLTVNASRQTRENIAIVCFKELESSECDINHRRLFPLVYTARRRVHHQLTIFIYVSMKVSFASCRPPTLQYPS
ncbi:hypothetical protein TcasGA2_TC004481 [Tribolium castaneum]|uniref:Uncharacterized protein n=1 Tax=Tribolium castaneum TaxID=7070 RepID=D6WCI1_TRICA|nr:hypothetical protein TcasGA2_TC004481 [Tribolium castaneum]